MFLSCIPELISLSYIVFFSTVAPPPINVKMTGSTSDSVTLSWSAASAKNLNGNIKGYELLYHIVHHPENVNYTSVPETSYVVEFALTGLESGSNFSIQVFS